MDPKPVYAPPPVIEPGHTFNTVTEQIAGIVLTRRHPYSWFFGLFIGFMMTMMLLMAITFATSRAPHERLRIALIAMLGTLAALVLVAA